VSLYFAYGSNLDADQMRARCPGSHPLFRARLEDHRLGFTYLSRKWRGGAADVLPAQGECVWGVVYALSDDDWPKLDSFEVGYARAQRRVLDDDDRAHDITTYVVVEKGRFPPTREYLDKILRWGAHWRFPEPYLDALRRVATREPVR
jgi:gamma-glutamylcyclotransferase (GGCT)/AIG2-like uncharacterized protein YtfP